MAARERWKRRFVEREWKSETGNARGGAWPRCRNPVATDGLKTPRNGQLFLKILEYDDVP